MFRAYGHNKSSIINGGLPCWVDEGLPLQTEKPQIPESVSYPVPNLDRETIRGRYSTPFSDAGILIDE